ncbi:hypothetical protein [Budvicia aquatica]|nr:hypothetical protein [Budvicia aquatica]
MKLIKKEHLPPVFCAMRHYRLKALFLALSIGFVMCPAQAVMSGSSGEINGRVPTASGNLIILLPDGATALTDNATVSSTAKPSEFTLGALTTGLTVVDVDGDAPLSMAVALPGATWEWRAPNGTPLTATQLTQSFSTSFANDDILTVKVSGPVTSTSDSGFPISGTDTYESVWYRVKIKALVVPTLQVNEANFAIDSGFPTTGFMDANFQFYMGGTNATPNGNYTYSSNQPDWVTVDELGNVTFTGTPTSANKTATITITDKSGAEAQRSFSFTIKTWFINDGGEMDKSPPQVDAYCSGLGGGYGTPSITRMTNATAFYRHGVRNPTGGWWPEWGDVDGWDSDGWVPNYVARESQGVIYGDGVVYRASVQLWFGTWLGLVENPGGTESKTAAACSRDL